ncbi:rhomboid family intramembrane serine protease [Alteromonas aestuariivivens]|uniref:Rhomboid family intramembrane serine protease n=2 Tax=Alteromonas aestuariivivens TaxID=1938339 RepID=A0A3D8MFT0_9ALTE|nr:rhomboid family intramembrane serine protease [Alteromonas aestuariivivens]RDV29431.1 rhomboid family intramembrane serine protease [Alteromonas aestuariivivens]
MNQTPTLKKQLRFLTTVAMLLIGVEFINLLSVNSLNHFGLVPRDVSSLPFLFTAPFVHGTPQHLIANLIPLLLFMWLALQWGTRTFWLVTLSVCLIGGLGVWCFGRSAVHIGASGMVYGFFGFLLIAGFRSRKIPYIVISVLVALLYGGLLGGLLPTREFISFEYHIFGFIGGIIAAWAWGK